ncbi:MAG: DNA mismatch endonuclease Vsr, partial [Chloroflexi bacterium]|nr:DNA mismatch endonuclease Vsr [Chloroflexota bacterium]
SLGYRYRLHVRRLPGRPDLVFKGKRKAIFVHGCFWHQHPDPSCADARIPKSNVDYWLPKLRRNAERDFENIRALNEEEWRVLVIWECETRDFHNLESRLDAFLRGESSEMLNNCQQG